MSKEKFTKGKWKILESDIVPCEVRSKGGLVITNVFFTDLIAGKANRDLIVKSPDLYRMVKKMQGVIEKLDSKHAILGDAEILLMEARGE